MTLAALSVACPRGTRRSTRASTRRRTSGGSSADGSVVAAPGWSRAQVTSCSRNSGLPPPRSAMRRTRSGGRASPRLPDPARALTSRSASSGARPGSDTLVQCARARRRVSRSATRGSSRAATTSRIGRSATLAARCSSSPCESSSSQWASSMTTVTGPLAQHRRRHSSRTTRVASARWAGVSDAVNALSGMGMPEDSAEQWGPVVLAPVGHHGLDVGRCRWARPRVQQERPPDRPPRQVRPGVTRCAAGSGRDDTAAGRLGHELGDQPGLAHPGVTGEHQHLALAVVAHGPGRSARRPARRPCRRTRHVPGARRSRGRASSPGAPPRRRPRPGRCVP